MRRLIAITVFATICSLAHAQAPIERQPPAALAPTGVNAWPTPHAVKRGTNLHIILSSDSENVIRCKLRSIEADKILCASGNIYNRADVKFIERTSLSFRADLILRAAGVVILSGLVVSLDGAPAGAATIMVGLGMLITGAVVYAVDRDHNERYPIIYSAPAPAPYSPRSAY
jgi:hypothetical protein